MKIVVLLRPQGRSEALNVCWFLQIKRFVKIFIQLDMTETVKHLHINKLLFMFMLYTSFLNYGGELGMTKIVMVKLNLFSDSICQKQ